jgi:phage repressor protein C with HTH and peptisase S24 domain
MSLPEEQIERMMIAAKVSKYSELAERLSESQSTLGSWKSRGVPEGKLYKAADILGCAIDWLRTGEGAMSPAKEQASESFEGYSANMGDSRLARLIEAWPSASGEIQQAAMEMVERSAERLRAGGGGGKNSQ